MGAVWQWGADLILTLQQYSPRLDFGMKLLSFLGGSESFMLLVPFVYWCVDAAWGMRILAVLLFADFTNGMLKWAFHTPRPYWVDTRVKALVAEASYGLPSGHAQVTTAVWGCVAVAVRRPSVWIATALLVLGVSLSRVYLGAHFPIDVAAGWIVGALVLAAYLWIEPRAASWLRPKSMAFHIAAVLILSVALLAAVFGMRAAITGTAEPRNIAGFFTNLGVAFGAGAGLALRRRYVSFDPKGPWAQRVIRLWLGLGVLLGIWAGLGVILPREPLAVALPLRYARYALIGLWTVWLAPWAFVRLGLAERAD